MQELINKLVAEAGISADQAAKSVDVIKEFVKDKFPMLAGAVDNIFSNAAAAEPGPASTEAPKAEGGSLLDKISDFIPGDLGEKIEGFAKKAADAAEEGFDKAKEVAQDLYQKGNQKLEDWEKKV